MVVPIATDDGRVRIVPNAVRIVWVPFVVQRTRAVVAVMVVESPRTNAVIVMRRLSIAMIVKVIAMFVRSIFVSRVRKN